MTFMNSAARRAAIAAALCCLAAATAQAQGKGSAKHHDQQNDQHHDQQGDQRRDRDRDHENGDRDHDGRARSTPPGLAKKGGVPPGLAKKGGLPPGQAKKLYRADDGVGALRDVFGRRGYTVTRTESHGEDRYVYYRLRDGAEHRAVVVPGTERLGFTNVPSAVLRDVLARLY